MPVVRLDGLLGLDVPRRRRRHRRVYTERPMCSFLLHVKYPLSYLIIIIIIIIYFACHHLSDICTMLRRAVLDMRMGRFGCWLGPFWSCFFFHWGRFGRFPVKRPWVRGYTQSLDRLTVGLYQPPIF